ncbi:MAG: RNA polymerase sigma factor [Cryomorphaceae bacterium]
MNVSAELIAACKQNKRKAQFELYKVCYALMMQICLRYNPVDADAQVALNESFLKVCTKIDHYKEHVPFALWIRRITINTCIDQFRKRNTEIDTTFQDIDDHSITSISSASNDADLSLDAEALRAMIRQLPAVSQQVFNLVVLDGYPYEEVAELLDITVGTCRWHVHFSRKTLQAQLEGVSSESKSKAV